MRDCLEPEEKCPASSTAKILEARAGFDSCITHRLPSLAPTQLQPSSPSLAAMAQDMIREAFGNGLGRLLVGEEVARAPQPSRGQQGSHPRLLSGSY